MLPLLSKANKHGLDISAHASRRDILLDTLTVQQGAELLGARMVGRWKSGAPVDLSPTADDPTLGVDPTRNNNFDYNHPLSLIITDQSHCPFSAHIRKTRPRGDELNLNILNQGVRGGIPFGPEVTSSETSSGTTSQNRGLAFGEWGGVWIYSTSSLLTLADPS